MATTMKLGDKLASDIRAVAKSLSVLADAFESVTPTQAKTDDVETAGDILTAAPPKPETAAKPIALEDVRAVLAEKSRAGLTAQVRELLLAHGAAKLSEIDPAEYPALLAEAEGIGKEGCDG